MIDKYPAQKFTFPMVVLQRNLIVHDEEIIPQPVYDADCKHCGGPEIQIYPEISLSAVASGNDKINNNTADNHLCSHIPRIFSGDGISDVGTIYR